MPEFDYGEYERKKKELEEAEQKRWNKFYGVLLVILILIAIIAQFFPEDECPGFYTLIGGYSMFLWFLAGLAFQSIFKK